MSQAQSHPTAVVATGARLGADVVVGPYAVIGEPVEIGAGTVIGPHAVIHPYVRVGERNRIHAHAVLGDLPQDITFEGTETWVEIGDDNTFREGVTIHRATRAEQPTRVGSNCFFLVYAHVAHDCRVGDRVTLTNNVCLGGHVDVGERAILGGGALIHQFCRIGALAMVTGSVGLRKDVLPYSLIGGPPPRHYGLNKVGLRRAGVTQARYQALEKAFRALRDGKALDELPDTPELDHLRQWLAAPSKRGLTAFLREP